MYSAAVYNYFNSSRHSRKYKLRRSIPIPKPIKNRRINICIECGRKFIRVLPQNELECDNIKQPRNAVYEKLLLIWKYAKNLLSKNVPKHDNKCSFKIIAHKSYKKRSLRRGIFKTPASLYLYCQICEKKHKERAKGAAKEEQTTNDKEISEVKKKTKPLSKKKVNKKAAEVNKKISDKELPTTTETTDTTATTTTPSRGSLRGKKRPIKLCTRSSRSSFQRKKQKKSGGSNVTKAKSAAKKPTLKKQNETNKNSVKKSLAPKKKFNTNKKKRLFLKENRKRINRFSSWQYMQHALNSVNEENSSSPGKDDKTPVYLTFEEYCLILKAIDLPEDSAEGIETTDEECSENPGTSTKSEDIGTNTEQKFIKTEDVATNTENAFASTGQMINTTEELNTFEEITEQVSATETNGVNEETHEINEELNEASEHLSATTETLDAVNELLTEAVEDFDANKQTAETIINIEITKANEDTESTSPNTEGKPENTQNSSDSPATNDEPSNNSTEVPHTDSHRNLDKNLVPNNSYVDINETQRSQSIDPTRLSEEIEKIRSLNRNGPSSTTSLNQ